MRTFGSWRFLVTQDVDQQRKLVDQVVSFDDTDETTSAEATSLMITLEPSQADYVFPFGGITTATCVYVVAFGETSIKLNGVGQAAIPLRPTPAADAGEAVSMLQKSQQPGGLLLRGDVTSIHLTNPSSDDPVTVYVAIVGNAS